MLVHDRLTVDILFICYTAGDDCRAVMLLMCGLVFRFFSLVHVYSFMNATRDMHISTPSVCLSVCLSLCRASDVVVLLLLCFHVVVRFSSV